MLGFMIKPLAINPQIGKHLRLRCNYIKLYLISLLFVQQLARIQPCIQAQQFVQQAQRLGTQAQLLALPLSHIEINRSLGKNNEYTEVVNQFIQTH